MTSNCPLNGSCGEKRRFTVYNLYVVECSNRDEVQSALWSASIDSGVHYPVPLHRQESFATEWVDRCL